MYFVVNEKQNRIKIELLLLPKHSYTSFFHILNVNIIFIPFKMYISIYKLWILCKIIDVK